MDREVQSDCLLSHFIWLLGAQYFHNIQLERFRDKIKISSKIYFPRQDINDYFHSKKFKGILGHRKLQAQFRGYDFALRSCRFFWKKTRNKFEFHIFPRLLVPFVSKLVDFSKRSAVCLLRTLTFATSEVRRHFPSKRFPSILQRLTGPQKIDQFGRKRYQKKGKDICCILLEGFFQKYLVLIG